MWLRAVFGEITSRAAISLLDSPRATSRSTSISRAVSPAGPSAAAPDAVPGGGEHGLDRVGVQPPGLDLGAQLGGRVLGRERRPMRARLAHRLVGVGGAEDPGRPG